MSGRPLVETEAAYKQAILERLAENARAAMLIQRQAADAIKTTLSSGPIPIFSLGDLDIVVRLSERLCATASLSLDEPIDPADMRFMIGGMLYGILCSGVWNDCSEEQMVPFRALLSRLMPGVSVTGGPTTVQAHQPANAQKEPS